MSLHILLQSRLLKSTLAGAQAGVQHDSSKRDANTYASLTIDDAAQDRQHEERSCIKPEDIQWTHIDHDIDGIKRRNRNWQE